MDINLTVRMKTRHAETESGNDLVICSISVMRDGEARSCDIAHLGEDDPKKVISRWISTVWMLLKQTYEPTDHIVIPWDFGTE